MISHKTRLHSPLQMFTPSGRFAPDKKICFSMSDFHPASVSVAHGLL